MGGVLEGSDFFEVSKYIREKVCGEDNWRLVIGDWLLDMGYWI